MNREQAQALIDRTFRRRFDLERFREFAGELLNTAAWSETRRWAGTEAKARYHEAIAGFELLGSYSDPDGEKLDILAVRLHKEVSLYRARYLQRGFIADFLKNRGFKQNALVAFVPPDGDDWRFSLVHVEYETAKDGDGAVTVEEKVTAARRYSFLVGPQEPSHTAQAQLLGLLVETGRNPRIKDILDAFSVDKVTKDFYRDYSEIFHDLEKSLTGLEQEERRLFAQTLCNRLMFLRFIERKGWLTFDGQNDYLKALWQAGPLGKQSFYKSRLKPLFFEGLAKDSGQQADAAIIGKVPFLNGGLFEETPLDRKVKDVSDTAIQPFVEADGLFYRYNFTVDESTPLDIEVAVDPEMLGKVFEELVTGRHESGSYYTPRPIVSFNQFVPYKFGAFSFTS